MTGRVAVITGASKGIGRVMSQLFAREGAKVACLARSGALVEETVAAIRQAGGEAIALTLSAADDEQVPRAIEQTIRAFGPVTALVNNAGDSGPTKPIQEYSTTDWHETINSSMLSTFLCMRHTVPSMIEAGGGAIVNISSMAARRGLPFRVGYCAAKAGQIGMTYGMAVELGPHNITVNAIAPGAVAGARIDRVVEAQAAMRGIPVEAMRKAFVDRSPLKRMATADDIASLAAFLCSDLARNISGQCIPVTAGEAG